MNQGWCDHVIRCADPSTTKNKHICLSYKWLLVSQTRRMVSTEKVLFTFRPYAVFFVQMPLYTVFTDDLWCSLAFSNDIMQTDWLVITPMWNNGSVCHASSWILHMLLARTTWMWKGSLALLIAVRFHQPPNIWRRDRSKKKRKILVAFQAPEKAWFHIFLRSGLSHQLVPIFRSIL